MKHVKNFKLYESPDTVYSMKYRNKELDKFAAFGLGFNSKDSITFGYLNNKIKVSYTKYSTHQKIGGRDNLKYAGRFWSKRKIISFWEYPNSYNELIKILKDIDDEYQNRCKNDPKNCKNFDIIKNINDWKIDIGNIEIDKKISDFEDIMDYDDYEDKFMENRSIIIPIIEYKNAINWTPEQKAKAHFANWNEKEKLKKDGFYNNFEFGSKKQNKRLKNAKSMTSDRVMTSAQWNYWKKTENVMTFDTFNEIPVTQYVDLDYFNINIEMDEKEPPNPTGRDDRETKNKTKKSIVKISVT